MQQNLINYAENQDLTPFFDHDDDSLTLATGREVLSLFGGDAGAGIRQFRLHAAEIALSSILARMDEMTLTDEVEQLFNHILSLVNVLDEVN